MVCHSYARLWPGLVVSLVTLAFLVVVVVLSVSFLLVSLVAFLFSALEPGLSRAGTSDSGLSQRGDPPEEILIPEPYLPFAGLISQP